MHKSHCIWKGWGEDGHPPTNVCVRCGCFFTFRCGNLRKVCKGSFSTEAARKRVGGGKHPQNGQILKGWSKVSNGAEGIQVGFPLGVPLQESVRLEGDEAWGMESGWLVGVEGREREEDEEPDDWGLWMGLGQGQEEEELHREGFLGFDDP